MILGLIPSRLNSKRLKHKPLLIIDGLPIIVHTFKRAMLSKKLDRVIVCCDDKKIFDVVKKHGGEAMLTSKKHKNVLIPRPETELLVNKIIELFKEKKIRILDIGTGSGCIILSILSELKKSSGIGVDISQKAILVAKKNAAELSLLPKVKFLNKSFESIFDKKFDLIVSNPPYIESKDIKNLSCDIKKFEPKIALDGGNDGLDLIKKVIYKSKNILKINGMLALEIGNEQIKKVSKILTDNNFCVRKIIKDYKNNVRCVFAHYK